MEVVSPHVLAIGSLVPVQKSSPEKRHQKEIVAGEERPKFLSMNQTEDAQGNFFFSQFIHQLVRRLRKHKKLAIYHASKSNSLHISTLDKCSEFMTKSSIENFFISLRDSFYFTSNISLLFILSFHVFNLMLNLSFKLFVNASRVSDSSFYPSYNKICSSSI